MQLVAASGLTVASAQGADAPVLRVRDLSPLTADGAANVAKIQARIDAIAWSYTALQSGGTVLIPPGLWPTTGTIANRPGITLQGAGPAGSFNGPSVLQRTTDTVMVTLDGAGPDVATQRFRGGGIKDLVLHGSDTAAAIVQQTHGSSLTFEGVAFLACTGLSAVDCVDIQDSFITRCRWDFCANTNTAGATCLRIRNSAATSGWRSSTNNSNEIRIRDCIFESFKGSCVTLEPGLGSAAPMNGVYIDGFKMESGAVRAPFIMVAGDCFRVMVTRGYAYGDALDAGASAVDFLQDYSGATFRDVEVSTPAAVFRSFAQVWDNGYHDYQGVAFGLNGPTTCFVESMGTNTPTLTIQGNRWGSTAPLVSIPGGGAPKIVSDSPAAQVVSWTGTVTPDPYAGETIQATLTGNTTVNAPARSHIGQRLRFIFTQDATGSRTVTWNAAYKLAGGTWSPTTTANKTNVIEFERRGAVWSEVTRSLNQ